MTTLKTGKYRKLQLRGKGFGWAYKLGGLYPDGLISGRKKKRFEMSNSTVDRRMI